MLIYETLDEARAGEPGLVVTPQGKFAPARTFEADWGYRLRGGGLPGGTDGWLLTFAGHGSGFDEHTGWLIAYEIADNDKTGRVAIVRRDWNSALDNADRERILKDSTVWSPGVHTPNGEGDIDVLDTLLSGNRL